MKQCPNCGSFKIWRPGSTMLWGGVIFAVLSIPWMLILIGIPCFIAGVILALLGWGTKRAGNPMVCRNCHWKEEIIRST